MSQEPSPVSVRMETEESEDEDEDAGTSAAEGGADSAVEESSSRLETGMTNIKI